MMYITEDIFEINGLLVHVLVCVAWSRPVLTSLMVTAEWALSISECAGWARSLSPPSEFIIDDDDFRMNLLPLTTVTGVTGRGCKNSELSSVSTRGVDGALLDVNLALVRKFHKSSRFPASGLLLRGCGTDFSLTGCRSDAVDERCNRTASFTVRWLEPEPPEASPPFNSHASSVEEICSTGGLVLLRLFLTLDRLNMIRSFSFSGTVPNRMQRIFF